METLYNIHHAVSNALIGIGNDAEIDQLCRDGILSRDEIVLVVVGTFAVAA